MATTITFYNAMRQDADGKDVVQGTIKVLKSGLVTEGLADDVVGTARRRLWNDERIVQYYSNWSNGYSYSTAQ